MDYGYIICINDQHFNISGTEATWDAYRKAYAFGERVQCYVCLVDAHTGEVIDDNLDED